MHVAMRYKTYICIGPLRGWGFSNRPVARANPCSVCQSGSPSRRTHQYPGAQGAPIRSCHFWEGFDQLFGFHSDMPPPTSYLAPLRPLFYLPKRKLVKGTLMGSRAATCGTCTPALFYSRTLLKLSAVTSSPVCSDLRSLPNCHPVPIGSEQISSTLH